MTPLCCVCLEDDIMGMLIRNGSVADFFRSIEEAAKVYQESVFKIAKEEADKAVAKTYTEFGQYQAQMITKIFNDAVNQFYAAYTPNFYDRHDGLYDVLDMTYDQRGIVITGDGNKLLFNKSEMHGDRRGGDLFNKVFIEGWHGGAESSYRGDHPESGVPYYRKPVGYYKYWGRRAVQTESPYHIINEALEIVEVPNMTAQLQSILDKNAKIAEIEIVKKIKILQQEIFG